MSEAVPIRIAGAVLHAVLGGALLWAEEDTLIVADLHLEKGSSFADRRRPQFVPPYDTRTTVARLETLLIRHHPRRVVCLGDTLHDGRAPERIDGEDAARIVALTRGRDWFWIAGNHDPDPPSRWGGSALEELAIGGIVFRHRASPARPDAGTGEISGHFHPTASVATRAAKVSRRCFVKDGRRVVLPAFGAFAGGLNVLDPAIAGLFDDAFDVVMLGSRRLFAFSNAALAA
jgi:DNA ligase-associated metallophosphoesterase